MAKTKSRGLGDTVAKITKATGIQWLVGECEDCEKRKQKLNQLFRYTPAKGCINESEYSKLKEVQNLERLKLSEQLFIKEIFVKVWGFAPTFSIGCAPCNATIMGQIKELIKVYEEVG